MFLKRDLMKTNKHRMIPFLKQVKISFKNLIVKIFRVYLVSLKICPG